MKFILISKKSKIFSVNPFNYNTSVFGFKSCQNFIDLKIDFKPVIISKFSFSLLSKKRFNVIVQQYFSNPFINLKKFFLFDNNFVYFSINSYLLLRIFEYGIFHFFYLKHDFFLFFFFKYTLNSLLVFNKKDLIAINSTAKNEIAATVNIRSKKFIK